MKKNNWVSYLSLISQVGISMITPIFMCILFGAYLDDKTGKSPLFVVIFIFLGVGGAFRNLFYIVGKAYKKGDKHE